MNGLMVGAAGVILIVYLTTTGLGNLFGTIGSNIGDIADLAGTVAQEQGVTPEDAQEEAEDAAAQVQEEIEQIDPNEAFEAVRNGAFGTFLGMLLPVIAALFIMVGAPARLIARFTSIGMLLVTVDLVATYDRSVAGFQFVTKMPVSDVLGLSLSFGADGLSLALLLLSAIVTVSAIWVIPPIKTRENLFYACVLLISAGVIGKGSTPSFARLSRMDGSARSFIPAR